MSTHRPSAFFGRAARSERSRIERSLESLALRRQAIVAQLADIDAETAELERLAEVIDTFAGGREARPQLSAASERGEPARGLLRGKALRIVAAQLLRREVGTDEAHYRDIFEQILAAGYAVGGKEPLASFLANLRDSPAVIHGERQGHYRLDSTAAARVESAISEAEAELADVRLVLARDDANLAGSQLAQIRDHRQQLERTLRRLNSEASELEQIFSGDVNEGHDERPGRGNVRLRVA
jgi:hypothetical protein